MDTGWALLVDVMATLAGAFLLGMVFERFCQSAVLGYILAGVALGPHLTRVVRDVDAVRDLSELGIALVLFTIGLEFSWKELRKLGPVGLGGGSVQILLTGALGFGVSILALLDWHQAVAVGAIVALSSTVVVLRALRERGDLDAPHGKAALGVLLVQDAALIPLVMLFTALAKGPRLQAPDLGQLGAAVAQISVAVVLFVLLGTLLLPRVLRSRAMARNRELPILLAVTTCVGAAWAAHSIGISPSLGAFVAGLLLAETGYAVQLRADVAPLRALFATLFFASIGMLMDVRWFAANVPLVLGVTAAIVVGKAAAAAMSVRPFHVTTISSLATGFTLAQVGELSFVLLQFGLFLDLIDKPVGHLLTSATVLSLLACPYMVAGAPGMGKWIARRILPVRRLLKEERLDYPKGPTLKDHVIVVGYGPAGRVAAETVRGHGCTVLVLELDRRLVQLARSRGLQAWVGDGTQGEVLEHARAAAARGVIVALSDHRVGRVVVGQVRSLAPTVPVVARARYHLFQEEIAAAGANRVVDEEEWVGRRLGDEALLQAGLLWDTKGEEL